MEESGTKESPLRIMVKGGFFVLLGVLLSKLLWYIYRIIVARYLGAEDYGLFSLAFSIFMTTMLLSKIGIPLGITRFVSKYIGKKDDSKVRGTIFSAFELTLPLSILAGLSLFILSPSISLILGEPRLTPILQIFALAIPFRTFLKDVIEVFKAFKRMDYFSGIENIFQPLVLVLLTIALIYSGYGVIGVAVAYTLSVLFAGVLGFYLLQSRIFPIFGDYPTDKNHEELLKYSLPLLVVGIGQTISAHIDNFMLGWFPNTVASDIGIYNSALPTAYLISSLSTIFAIILFPLISTHLAKGEDNIASKLISVAVRWTLITSLPLTLVLILFSSTILNTFFGSVYTEGATVLSIIALGILVKAVVTPIGKYLLAIDKTRWMMFNSLAIVLTNTALNYLLIPQYGILGAGIAVAISFLIFSLLIILEVLVILKLSLSLRSIWKPIFSASLSLLIIYSLRLSEVYDPSIISELILLLGTYSTSFVFSNGFEPEDIIIVEIAEEKLGTELRFLKNLISKMSSN